MLMFVVVDGFYFGGVVGCCGGDCCGCIVGCCSGGCLVLMVVVVEVVVYGVCCVVVIGCCRGGCFGPPYIPLTPP